MNAGDETRKPHSGQRLSGADAHRVPLEELCAGLGTSVAGLSAAEAAKRLHSHGRNRLALRRESSQLVKFLRNFSNLFALLLFVAAGLALLIHYLEPDEGTIYLSFALLAVVLVNGTFTYLQGRQSERILASFRRLLPDTVAVLRDGVEREILAEELVPGDVMLLAEGDDIPADGRLIEQVALKVDNSPLTGESAPELRSLACTHHNLLESRNMVFSGTFVRSGHGKALVYATGMDTQIGQVVRLTRHTHPVLTPIRRELNHFVHIISLIALGLGMVFFGLSLAIGSDLLHSLLFAIGIIVANVPEGLLPTVTLALAIVGGRMVRRRALVQHLESVETLGSTSVICTDKTGTLTENRMRVASLALGEAASGSRRAAGGDDLLRLAMILCNNAHRQAGRFSGDPTEIALLQFAAVEADLDAAVRAHPRLAELPFDSLRKRMATSNRMPDGSARIFVKGAPEVVLPMCEAVLEQGRPQPLAAAQRQGYDAAYRRLAGQGERVLAVATGVGGDVSREQGLVLLGLVGLADPPRPEVPAAIARCRSAGIKVIMVTGDGSLTAEAIARQVGLFTGEGRVVTGEALSGLTDAGLDRLLQEPELACSRTSSAQRLRIVSALRRAGETVTVTGDGVNDAPALKHADLGVAMGVGGTEVAQAASQMVLLDNNFASIVDAVEEGRAVFDNIRKFIAYILTSNVPEILPFIAFILLGIPLPLTIVLILAIDLGTDMLPALGLGQERPERDVMRRPPRPRGERLLTRTLLRRAYGLMGPLEAGAGFFAYFTVLYAGGWSWGAELAAGDPLYLKAVSAFFAAVILCQVANVMISRARQESLFSLGLFSNRMILTGIAVALIMLFALLYVPPLQRVFGTTALTPTELLLGLPFALLMIALDELRKRSRRPWVARWLGW